MCLGPPIARKSWNSISSLFCTFISYFLHSLFAFSQFIFQKKKRVSHFIIIKHELCFPPVYNLLMKIIQRIIQEILAFISFFAFL